MSLDPRSDEARIAAHRDYFRTVHPDVKAAALAEYEAKRAALSALEDRLRAAALEVTAALEYVDRIHLAPRQEVSYTTMQRSGFRRKDGWARAYTLQDARGHANTAAMALRRAWEILDPRT